MDRYHTKRQLTARRKQKKLRLRWVVLPALFLGLLSGGGYYLYRYHADWYTKAQAFVAEKREKHRAKQLAATVTKKTAARVEATTPPPLHFEFYTTLPNMKKVDAELSDNKPRTVIADADALEQELSDAVQQTRH